MIAISVIGVNVMKNIFEQMPDGLYEQVINRFLSNEMAGSNKLIITELIDHEIASKVMSKYISDIIEKGLDDIKELHKEQGMQKQISLINKIVDLIIQETDGDTFEGFSVDERGEQLLAIVDKTNSVYGLNEKSEIPRPVTSIAQSSLFTGAIHEPSMYAELKKEILSSNRIDMLMSFIKWSGLRLIIDELKEFTKHGKLRIITTSYMGATDVKAVEALNNLPNTEIKISYDTKRTRLHAKAYVFHRNTGFTTAYIGSSNLSNAAISSGLEWNIKTTSKDLPDTIIKMEATFESYWNSSEFITYQESEKQLLETAIKNQRNMINQNAFLFNFDIYPYPYQQEILDKLDAERKVKGYKRNLVVAATGTGKTVISAFDYKRYCNENKGKACRLLFVAHREEILQQSIACFRAVLKQVNFGDLFVGSHQPESLDYLFISIQTFNSREFEKVTSKDFYDYIIVDEFHHAAAPTYQTVLTHYNPEILLGLTATPERMDGKSILEYFNNRIAAEIRLPEAINRKLLSPFQYFGVADDVDLGSLRWTRGGYEKSELSRVYTGNDMRAKQIAEATYKYVTDMKEVKGIGFCVSIEHALYMAKKFNEYGIPSICLTGDSERNERNTAKKRLVNGEISFIFVVDLYNEGVDIPEINTVLFLRPTESLTVFLQQLGRGLRLAENKECLTALDFIGQANKKYRFEDKFNALLENTRMSIQKEIKDGFISLPKGCYIQLEKKAKEYILENIRSAVGTRSGLVGKIACFTDDTGKELTLANFLDYHHIDIKEIYKASRNESFSRLCVIAEINEDFNEEFELVLSKTFSRICRINSRRWIKFLLETLPKINDMHIDELSCIEYRMLNMLHFTIWQSQHEKCGFDDILGGLKQLANNPVMLTELSDILRYQYDRIDFVDEPVGFDLELPLDLHCSYTRDQILVALDYMKPTTVREGVFYLPDKKTDVFFITLNKAEKNYSPSTMYHDYSINEWLFHWQSQSTTSVNSPTGQRYINHKASGNNILLFVREFKMDVAGPEPYTFLGLADYVSHDGSNPINFVWKLRKSIPAKFLKKTNKLIVG